VGLKAQDYHILLLQLLPVALRNNLDKDAEKVLIEFCVFFNELSSKVIDVDEFVKLEEQVVVTAKWSYSFHHHFSYLRCISRYIFHMKQRLQGRSFIGECAVSRRYSKYCISYSNTENLDIKLISISTCFLFRYICFMNPRALLRTMWLVSVLFLHPVTCEV